MRREDRCGRRLNGDEPLPEASGIASFPAAPGEHSAIRALNHLVLPACPCGPLLALTPGVYPGRRGCRELAIGQVQHQLSEVLCLHPMVSVWLRVAPPASFVGKVIFATFRPKACAPLSRSSIRSCFRKARCFL